MKNSNILYELLSGKDDTNCDKKCENCGLYLQKEKMCWHKHNRIWEKWAKQEHIRFQQYMKDYKL